MTARHAAYAVARLLGDAAALRRGLVLRRIQRRLMGRWTGRAVFRRLVRGR